MKMPPVEFPVPPEELENEGKRKVLNSELWHACAGPLLLLPPSGSRVVYFPQGHCEQVAASTNKEVDGHLPNYPNLSAQLICTLHDVIMRADVETDEVYAQLTLQPLCAEEQKEVCFQSSDMCSSNKQPSNYFCKTLTASDTSTHGGFSVPRRAAEKVFPPLDYTQQPPAQELIARDLHENEWKFRHIFRGQPRRHLLTTGWSVFVSAKRLVAGDSVIFIWNEKNQLLLGIRRANPPQTIMPSSVLSINSLNIGLVAAAQYANSTNSRFSVFFNPRACPAEFVVPLSKYVKAVYNTHVSVGMRFRMLFETEESSVRRYMGTITGICDLDPVRWPNSYWRSVKVGWDESTAGERQPRVSLWEIEPLTTFPMCPSLFPLRLKCPWPSGLPLFPVMKDGDVSLSSPPTLLQREAGDCSMPSLNFQGYGLTPWMQPSLDTSMVSLQPDVYQAMDSSALQDPRTLEKRPNQSLLQFQTNQNSSCQSVSLMQNQILQQPQSQQNLVQTFQENQAVSQNQVPGQLLQQQLCSWHPYDDQQCLQPQQHQQLSQFDQLQNQFSDQQNISKVKTVTPSFVSSAQLQPTSMEAFTSPYLQEMISNCVVNPVSAADISLMHSLLNSFSQNEGSLQFSLPDCTPLVSSSALLSKQVVVSSSPMLTTSPARYSLPPVEDMEGPQTRISGLSSMLPPLPSREFSAYQGIGDGQNNLFGVNAQQDELSNLNSSNWNDSFPLQFACSNFPSATGTDFVPGSVMTSVCGQSSENEDQGNISTVNLVKVHKTGSSVRSLDISIFGSYEELHSELTRLFVLEGQREDPVRSGWQLVFVDRDNDALLLGDDPWHEFVKNVSGIKIVSPQEAQMGKEGFDLPHGGQRAKLQNSYNTSQQDMIYNSNGMGCIASYDY